MRFTCCLDLAWLYALVLLTNPRRSFVPVRLSAAHGRCPFGPARPRRAPLTARNHKFAQIDSTDIIGVDRLPVNVKPAL